MVEPTQRIPPSKVEVTDCSGLMERCVSVQWIAERANLSVNKVRDIFRDEPGVWVIGEPRPKFGRRRGKVTLRIPESVLKRVLRRMSNPSSMKDEC